MATWSDTLRHAALAVEGKDLDIERLRAFVELYLKTYADTDKHPTVVQEAEVINSARALLATTTGLP